MGGMIAQTMAIERPERVLSLTSIMSTTGNRRVGRPRLRVMGVLMRPGAPREAGVRRSLRARLPDDRRSATRWTSSACASWPAVSYDRQQRRHGRQLAAILASGGRTPQLRRLDVPTTVFHGRADPLVPFRAGRATAAAIPAPA